MAMWKRDVALVGTKERAQELKEALGKMFPAEQYPAHIDAMGGQGHTYILVHVYNDELKIDRSEKAIPEDFLEEADPEQMPLLVTVKDILDTEFPE